MKKLTSVPNLNILSQKLANPLPNVALHFLKEINGIGKSLSEALLYAENGDNMFCTKNVLNVRNNFCKQHVLPSFELGIFMY